LIMVKGAVPGAKGGWVLLRDASKYPIPKDAALPAALVEDATQKAQEAEQTEAQTAEQAEAETKPEPKTEAEAQADKAEDKKDEPAADDKETTDTQAQEDNK